MGSKGGKDVWEAAPPRRAVGSGGLSGRRGMRNSARRWGAARRVGVGWERRLSSAFPPAPPSPGPPSTLAPRQVASSPVSLLRLTSLPRSLEVGSEAWGRGRGAQRALAPHHAPLPVAPATTTFHPAADRRARILRSHLAGCVA